MIKGIQEYRISKEGRNVKVCAFPGATTDDMYDYLKLLLTKAPDNIILHIGTNNAVNETSERNSGQDFITEELYT